MRSPVRVVLLLASTLFLLAGCKGNCRKLSEKLCDCSSTASDRNACMARASTSEGQQNPSPVDERTCAALLDGCDCHTINTAEGKVACGLARRPLDGGQP